MSNLIFAVIDLTSISKALDGVSKGNLNWLQIAAVLSPVVLGPGVSLVTSYVNGRNNLSSRRRELEHYQAVLQVVEQASKLSVDCEKLDQMFGDNRSSVLLQKIMHDAYATLKAPEISIYSGGYKFLLLRQIPTWAKYYATPLPKTTATGLLTAIYYIFATALTSFYVMLMYLAMSEMTPNQLPVSLSTATQAATQGEHFDLAFNVFMAVLVTIASSPFFYALSRFWKLLFNLRRRHEDILAGVKLDGPAKAVERPDFRIGLATASAVIARMGRPTSDQAAADGGRTLAYATARSRSWLWPIPLLGHLTGTIVAWFAGGAVLDVATEGFEFGPNGALTQTWMSRSHGVTANAGAVSPPVAD